MKWSCQPNETLRLMQGDSQYIITSLLITVLNHSLHFFATVRPSLRKMPRTSMLIESRIGT